MKRVKVHCAWALLLFLLMACKEDEYVYPSVKQEFLTAEAGNEGSLQTLITDQGKRIAIAQDLSGSKITPNTSVRIVSNYELLSEGSAKIYALLKTVSPVPQPESKFEKGVKTDPAEVTSIWMGRDYLNIILTVKAQSGQHLFHFVEECVEEETGEDGKSRKVITLMLYHDAGNDPESYSRRAYLSVPLRQYYDAQQDGEKELIVRFRYWTRNRDGEKVIETKYMHPGFIYRIFPTAPSNA